MNRFISYGPVLWFSKENLKLGDGPKIGKRHDKAPHLGQVGSCSSHSSPLLAGFPVNRKLHSQDAHARRCVGDLGSARMTRSSMTLEANYEQYGKVAACRMSGPCASHGGEGVWFFWAQLTRDSPTSVVPSDMKGKRGVSLRTFHAMVGHFSRPHDLGHVALSLLSGPPRNSVSYLMLCDYFPSD